MRKYLFCLAIITVMISSISCGKKVDSLVSDPAGTGGTAVDPSVVISFTTSGSISDNTVFLEEVSKNNNQITLALKVKGGSNVFGAAVEITYDSSLISYFSAAEGTYLKQDGNDTIFASSLNIDTSGNKQEGILLIGCNRRGNAPGANGDGVLATMIFRAKAKQMDTIIGFNAVNCALELPAGSSPKYIAGTSWVGGKLSYQ
jgi:hypothetical protein